MTDCIIIGNTQAIMFYKHEMERVIHKNLGIKEITKVARIRSIF